MAQSFFSSPGLHAFLSSYMIYLLFTHQGQGEVASVSCQIKTVSDIPTTKFSKPGHLNIGIIMPVHQYEAGKMCSDKIAILGVLQRMEAMVFAIDEINRNTSILPNVDLGFYIVDDCENDLTAFGRSLHFIQDTGPCTGSPADNTFEPLDVAAVIGAESSSRTNLIAELLHTYDVPILNYFASKAALEQFSNFFRIIPSENVQTTVFANMLELFRWTYVSVLFIEGDYGRSTYREFSLKTKDSGYCIATSIEIRTDFTDADYDETIDRLMVYQKARIVFLFMGSSTNVLKIFQACKRKQCQGHFSWVCDKGSCEPSAIFQDVKDQASGLLRLSFTARAVPRFEEYFQQTTLRSGSSNPWFSKFYESIFDCDSSTQVGSRACSLDRPIRNSSLYVKCEDESLAMDTVYALAHAIDAVLKTCPAGTLPKECATPDRIMETLNKVQFHGEHEYFFQGGKNAKATLDVINFYVEDGVLYTRTVGEWSIANMNYSFFKTDEIQWAEDILHESNTRKKESRIPVSVCQDTCAVGFGAKITSPCCWSCQKCDNNQRTIIVSNLPRCSTCPLATNFTWPDALSRTQCLPIPITYINRSQMQGALPMVLIAVVGTSSLVLLLLFCIYHCHERIKSNNRDISFPIIVGHVVTSALSVTFALDVSRPICFISMCSFDLSFTITYGTLFVNINRIYRISLAQNSILRRICLSSMGQIILITVFVLIQILIICVGMSLDWKAPVMIAHMPSIYEKYVENTCRHGLVFIVGPFTYNCVLLLACLPFIFKIHNSMTHTNQIRFIVIYIYTSILLWIAFFPGYLTAQTYTLERLWITVLMLSNMLLCQLLVICTRLFGDYFSH